MGQRFVVVGGGVAGLCCAEEICRLQNEANVVLITPDNALKGISKVVQISQYTEEIELEERTFDSVQKANLKIIRSQALDLDVEKKEVVLSNHSRVKYDRICICSGATPKAIADSANVLVLRDSDTVGELAARLPGVRRAVIVGNGGIALELVHALRGVEVVWAMKHGHIGDAFFDLDAASFLLTELNESATPQTHSACDIICPPNETPFQPFISNSRDSLPVITANTVLEKGTNGRHYHSKDFKPGNVISLPVSGAEQTNSPHSMRCSDAELASTAFGSPIDMPCGQALPDSDDRRQHGSSKAALQNKQPRKSNPSSFQMVQGRKNGSFGHAVGPKWTDSLCIGGSGGGSLILERGCGFDSLVSASEAEAQEPWPVHVRLTNGHVYGTDLVISAIGVRPNTQWLPHTVARDSETGGVLVDRHMRSTVSDVWAAGDACTVDWPDRSPHWFQMRLWTQARLMGRYAAQCMAGDPEEAALAFSFSLFTHATHFLGRRVVLLGLYNGQGLDDEPDTDIVTYSRTTEGPDATFVRVLLLRSRLMGAVLIGNTEYEEVFENLILDGLDLSHYGPDLLDPDIDLDHVFD